MASGYTLVLTIHSACTTGLFTLGTRTSMADLAAKVCATRQWSTTLTTAGSRISIAWRRREVSVISDAALDNKLRAHRVLTKMAGSQATMPTGQVLATDFTAIRWLRTAAHWGIKCFSPTCTCQGIAQNDPAWAAVAKMAKLLARVVAAA